MRSMMVNRCFRRQIIRFVTSLYLILTYQITEIAPYVRTYFWVTIWCKYHGLNWIPDGFSLAWNQPPDHASFFMLYDHKVLTNIHSTLIKYSWLLGQTVWIIRRYMPIFICSWYKLLWIKKKLCLLLFYCLWFWQAAFPIVLR